MQVDHRLIPRACFRAGLVAGHIVYGVLLAGLFPLLGREMRQRIVKRWSCKLLDVMHVGLVAHGDEPLSGAQAGLLVANHISWLDVIAMNAVAPACFVAKSEVGGWPVLGWLCRRAGTLFVRRDIRRDTVRINREVSALLGQGRRVALFPEGTSSDDLLPGHFHSSLLQGVIDAGRKVVPVAIRYCDGAGRACGDAAFIGDMSFVQSLWQILCSPSLHVSVHYLPPLECAGQSRRTLAANTQGAIHMALARFSPNHSVCVPGAAMPSGLKGMTRLAQA